MKMALFIVAVVAFVLFTVVPTTDSPLSNSIGKQIADFAAGPYILALVFVIYLAVIYQMSKRRTRASREAIKANEAIASVAQNYKKGEFAEVVKQCRDNLALYPNDAVLHWYLSLASYGQKDYETARTHFMQAAEIDPRYASNAQPFLDKIEQEWKPKLVK